MREHLQDKIISGALAGSLLFFACCAMYASAAGNGVVLFRSNPAGAEIFADGQFTGKTTIAMDTISSGDHIFTFLLGGYNEYSVRFTVNRDLTNVVPTAVLLPGTATAIMISSDPPGAKVSINNKFRGETTPGGSTFLTPSGSTSVMLEYNGYKSMSDTVVLSANRVTRRSYALVEVPPTSLPSTTTPATSPPTTAPTVVTTTTRTPPTTFPTTPPTTPPTIPKTYPTTTITSIPSSPTLPVTPISLPTTRQENTTTTTTSPVTTHPLTTPIPPAITSALEVSSVPPGAKVYLNGTQFGETNTSIPAIPPGEYNILLTKEGYEDHTETLWLLGGTSAIYNVLLVPHVQPLEPVNATLVIASSPPGATVYLDELSRGVTNLTFYGISPGPHQVRVVYDCHDEYATKLDLLPNETRDLSITLVSHCGTLTVSSVPSGAIVYLDGVSKGITSKTLTAVATGTHALVIRFSGYEDYMQSFTLHPDEVILVEAVMEPLPDDRWKWVLLIIVFVGGATIIWKLRSRRRKEPRTPSPAVRLPGSTGDPGTVLRRTVYDIPITLKERYTEFSLIGQGGIAYVFRARRRTDGSFVAVKVPINADEATGKSFIKEILAWEGLSHRNILQVYEANILPVPYIEMEYLPRTLADLPHPLPVKEATFLVIAVAEGLSYAHTRGIIHLDIKPYNILLTPDNVPKITDWGMSRLTSSVVVPGISGFSLAYAAPEQISALRFGSCDERTDIYQLGVVLYELVTGKLPFPGKTQVEVSAAVLGSLPVPPSRVSPAAALIDPVVMQCLEKERSARFQSVQDFIHALEALVRGD